MIGFCRKCQEWSHVFFYVNFRPACAKCDTNLVRVSECKEPCCDSYGQAMGYYN